LANIFAGVNIQFCDDVELGRYMMVANYSGFITEFTLHYVVLIDEKQNAKHQVPNSVVMANPRTFPLNPPLRSGGGGHRVSSSSSSSQFKEVANF
jgi:hypothetical protein